MADESKVLVRLRLLGAAAMGRGADQATGGLRKIDRQASRTDRALNRIGDGTVRVTGALRSMGRVLAIGAAGAAIGGTILLGGAIRTVATEYTEAARVGGQTNAVIKSTGGVANVTAREVAGLATAISNKTGIDDEQIQSAANMLLTFKKVRNETGKGNRIFDRATRTVTDMSAALGTDSTRAAIQLGKALNDPIKGITALRRVGVTFTDSQQKQITRLVEHGKILKAQKIILRELNTEFGGSAAAQAQPFDKLRTNVLNLAESLGFLAAPTVNKGISAVARFVQQINEGTGRGGRFAEVVKGIAGRIGSAGAGVVRGARGDVGGGEVSGAEKLGLKARQIAQGVIAFIAGIAPKVKGVAMQILDALKPAIPFLQNILLPLLIGIGKGVLVSIVAAFKVALPIVGFLAKVLGFVGEKAKPLRGVIEGIGMVIGFVAAGPILKLLGGLGKLGVVARVAALPIRFLGSLAKLGFGALKLLGAGAKLVGMAFAKYWTFVRRYVGFLGGLPGRVGRIAVNLVGSFINAITKLPGQVRGVIGKVINGVPRLLRSGVGKVVSAAGAIGRGIVKGIVAIIKKAPGEITSAVMNIVPGPVRGVVSDALGVAGDAVDILPFASGGVVRKRGAQLVGERGPEIARFPVGTRIHSAAETRRMLAAPRREPTRMLPTPPLTAIANLILDGRQVHQAVFKFERRAVEAT